MEESWWKDITDLDAAQKAVIALPLDGNYLVKGPAGCGKTNLLLLRANYLSVSGRPNLAIITYNRTLKEFIAFGAGRYDFTADKVKTHFSLFSRLLAEAGIKVEEGTYEQRRLILVQELLKITDSKAAIYDTLFVDEAQDYLPEEIEIFRRLSDNLFLVADSRQSIYTTSDITHLEEYADQTVTIESHYRTGPPICELADRVGAKFTQGYEPTYPNCNYKDSTPATFDPPFRGNFESQISEGARRVMDQRRLYPSAVIGVLTPAQPDVKLIASAFKKLGLEHLLCVQDREDGYQAIDSARPIWISTIHGAKGLEFRAVHLLGMDNIGRVGKDKQKRLAYTGITRARSSLTIYSEGELPDYLAGAIAEMLPPTPTQPLEAAFGNA